MLSIDREPLVARPGALASPLTARFCPRASRTPSVRPSVRPAHPSRRSAGLPPYTVLSAPAGGCGAGCGAGQHKDTGTKSDRKPSTDRTKTRTRGAASEGRRCDIRPRRRAGAAPGAARGRENRKTRGPKAVRVMSADLPARVLFGAAPAGGCGAGCSYRC